MTLNRTAGRRTRALIVGLGLAAVITSAAASDPQPFRELLEMSLKEKKGLVFYVQGQTIAGGVTRISEGAVEVKNREFGRIIIRLDRVDAVAAN